MGRNSHVKTIRAAILVYSCMQT